MMRNIACTILLFLVSLTFTGKFAAGEHFPENLEDLKKRQAVVNAVDENLRDLGLLALLRSRHCEGIVIKTGLVATVKHIRDERKKCFIQINTFVASGTKFSEEDDILLCRSTTPEAGMIRADISPRVGMPVYTLTNLGAKFIWNEIGKIDEITPKYIFVKGYIPVHGDSGRPFFSRKGEFLGLVHGISRNKKTREKVGTALVPAKLILDFMEKEKF